PTPLLRPAGGGMGRGRGAVGHGCAAARSRGRCGRGGHGWRQHGMGRRGRAPPCRSPQRRFGAGRGGPPPTGTDAALVLGYLSTGRFLDREGGLDATAAERAILEHVAEPLGMDLVTAARGIPALPT